MVKIISVDYPLPNSLFYNSTSPLTESSDLANFRIRHPAKTTQPMQSAKPNNPSSTKTKYVRCYTNTFYP
ncbi:hypothetical protein GA0116948_11072 [Chitinophaga costaii]|uniref:Uncharacterized protein n=1 Tax=Chitinophaga costaii TaxID=1335309 RepID=A0A1C4EWH4_9BACT|nr:hypothetical protein GA0116948_11072 [Chitinophaga costaii]